MTDHTVQLGFGVTTDGVLDVDAVHSHARGAMVNWLHRRGMRLTEAVPDEAIRDVFCKNRHYQRVSNGADIQLVVVGLVTLFSQDPDEVDLTGAPPHAPAEAAQ